MICIFWGRLHNARAAPGHITSQGTWQQLPVMEAGCHVEPCQALVFVGKWHRQEPLGRSCSGVGNCFVPRPPDFRMAGWEGMPGVQSVWFMLITQGSQRVGHMSVQG